MCGIREGEEIKDASGVSGLECLQRDNDGLGRVGEKAIAPHSSTLAWQIPWTEEPGGLQSMRSLRIGHD